MRRLQPAIDLLQLVATRVAGDVHQRVGVGDDLAALPGEAVLDLGDRLLVAGNGARGEDHQIALAERDRRVVVFGDAGERGAGLALAAGAQQQNLVGLQIGELVLVERRERSGR